MSASIVSYGFIQNALIAGFLMGIILPFIGIIVLMRRMIFISDSLGHVNMSGIAFATFLTSTLTFLGNIDFIIAITWSILAAMLIEYLRGKYLEYKEISIMVVYSLSIALTMIFLNLSTGYSSGLFNILFGNINAISTQEVKQIFILTVVLLIIFKFYYKKLILFSLEEENVKLYNLNYNVLRYVTIIIITLVITFAIKIIGVLLVSSLMIIPILAAGRLSDTLKKTIIYAIIFTEISIIGGIFLAYLLNLSTSAIIVLIVLFIYLMTLLFVKKK